MMERYGKLRGKDARRFAPFHFYTISPAPEITFSRDETLQKELDEGRRLTYQSQDKTILQLSGGGLALSIVLLKEFSYPNNFLAVTLLFLVWGLFAASLISVLMSFRKGLDAHDARTDQLEAKRQRDEAKEAEMGAKGDTLSKETESLNLQAGRALITAIILLVVFAMISLRPTTSRIPFAAAEKPIQSRGRALFAANDSEQPKEIEKKAVVPPKLPQRPQKPPQPPPAPERKK